MDPDTGVCQTEQPQISYSVDFTAVLRECFCSPALPRLLELLFGRNLQRLQLPFERDRLSHFLIYALLHLFAIGLTALPKSNCPRHASARFSGTPFEHGDGIFQLHAHCETWASTVLWCLALPAGAPPSWRIVSRCSLTFAASCACTPCT